MLIDDFRINALTRRILGSAIEVHRVLGPGLLESVYQQCLQYELSANGLHFVAQKAIPIRYKGVSLEACYRIDLIVEDLVLVEVKCVATMLAVHEAQAVTYLRLAGCPAALLINFNVPRLMDGVRRLLHTHTERGKLTVDTVSTPIRGSAGPDQASDTGSTGRPARPAD